jgi:hypothetical protein
MKQEYSAKVDINYKRKLADNVFIYIVRIYYVQNINISNTCTGDKFPAKFYVRFEFSDSNENKSIIKYTVYLTDPNYLGVGLDFEDIDKFNEFCRHAKVLKNKLEINNIELLLYSKFDLMQRIIYDKINFSDFSLHVKDEFSKVEKYCNEKGYTYEFGVF